MSTDFEVRPDRERESLIVVGNGMVGHRFLQALKARGLHEHYEVSVFGEEADPAYDRVALSSYMTRLARSELFLDGTADDDKITRYLGEAIVNVDATSKKVTSSSGRKVSYDVLILATGSIPFVPPVPGSVSQQCFVYRTLEDLDAIRAASQDASSAVVVGGGLLGLEAAGALGELGIKVDVVELANRPLPLQVDEGGGAILRRRLQDQGLGLYFSSALSEVEVGPDDRVSAVRLHSGETIDADMVVFATGVRPADALARELGLDVGTRGGVAVDRYCQSSDPSIFAIGECASVEGVVYGLVAPGYAMAEVVAGRLCGEDTSLDSVDTSAKLKLVGVDVASFGDAFGLTEGSLDVTYVDHISKIYKKLVLSGDAQRLLGGILVGDTSSYTMLRSLSSSSSPLTVELEQLLMPMGSGALSPSALDPSAIVCSCNNVPLGLIQEAITQGDCWNLGDLKASTTAGTGCGSCVVMMKSILSEKLKTAGKEISKAMCEHFEYSRQELFDLIRVQQITSFSDVISRHGTGGGCDICKPAIASILASRHGRHPLEGELASIQDTNDHVLANLQRDGSYSVVPRIPGGEVSPEGLVAIGTIAKEFGLYTKITGAQRIDMLGARLEDLPRIWARLVDEGFESGHAYGKALRTVKSCVGSTWCRFGVQDAVALAVELELRYRGLRSPHKVKAGVSGCARECAEARGKDIGVIATEKGWNLYLGGNGGFTPRHGEVFATDLDHETLIRYVDRFLMYYIRSADRLQRTSTWIESLDGGISHLKEVVIEDVLKLGQELEDAMETHVHHYEDEWKATLADPTKLAYFTSFINNPGLSDPDISFIPERSQHRPAGRRPSLDTPNQEVRPAFSTRRRTWKKICTLSELLPDRPVAAWVGDAQVAVVRLTDGSVHAIDNRDPSSGANVLARGLVGTRAGKPVIISPMYKQSFDLGTGACLDDPSHVLKIHKVRVRAGGVEVAS